MTSDIWSALITAAASVLIAAVGGAWGVYRYLAGKSTKAQAVTTVTTQETALATLKAELRAANRLITWQAKELARRDATILYLRGRLDEVEGRR